MGNVACGGSLNVTSVFGYGPASRGNCNAMPSGILLFTVHPVSMRVVVVMFIRKNELSFDFRILDVLLKVIP